MKIAVLGCGAVGSLFAASLSLDQNNEILCIVRSEEHAENINQSGIVINESDGSLRHSTALRAVTSTEDEEPSDLVIISVKSYDTLDAVAMHAGLFSPGTVVLTLQNGFGNHDDIITVVDPSQVLLGSTLQAVNIDSEGNIFHAANGITTLGPLSAATVSMSAAINTSDLLTEAGFEVNISDNPIDSILTKLLINVGINPVATLADSSNGCIIDNPELNLRAKNLVHEAIEVLSIDGHYYDKEEIWNSVQDTASATGSNICSMLQDVRSGRRTEISRINGAIIDIAARHGISAPLNEAIVKQIEELNR